MPLTLDPPQAVRFRLTISLIAVTLDWDSEPLTAEPGKSVWWLQWPYTLITLLLGWWGVPWGPVRTWATLRHNWFGGTAVPAGETAVTNSPNS